MVFTILIAHRNHLRFAVFQPHHRGRVFFEMRHLAARGRGRCGAQRVLESHCAGVGCPMAARGGTADARATPLSQRVERGAAITTGVGRRGFHDPSLYLKPANEKGRVVKAGIHATRRTLRRAIYVGMVALFAAVGVNVTASDWRNASREPVGLAPDPALVKEAVVQVYGARALGAKGYFGVHTWIAVKPTEAPGWTVYEVIGWRLRWAENVVAVRERPADARWFGGAPEVYAEKRGAGVDALIERIDKAARAYPYAKAYSLWPGPNSNTFTAWIARAVPELEVDLPATAIGKDYLGDAIFASAPSGSGFQVSLRGLLGFAVSSVDGVELNVLGLNFGVSPNGVKLPIVGRIGSFRPSACSQAEAVERSC